MDLLDTIHTRRTAGSFTGAGPTRDQIAALIEAAIWAPNRNLTQPWQFAVLAGDAPGALADAIAEDMAARRRPAPMIEFARHKLTRAPVIVVIAQVRRPDDPEADLEDYAACCCAVQNLLLAAHAAGIAAKWGTGTLIREPAAGVHLGLAETDRIVGFVFLGDPDPADDTEFPARHAPTVDWRGL